MQMPNELIAAFKAVRGDDVMKIAIEDALLVSAEIKAQRRGERIDDVEQMAAVSNNKTIRVVFNLAANIGDHIFGVVRRDLTGPISAPRKDSGSRRKGGLMIRNGKEMLGDVASARSLKK